MKLNVEETKLTVPVNETRDHLRGNSEARLTLLEYGDYECPYCGRAFPIVRQIQETLGTRLRFVFRHFPLNSVHPHASVAAQAAESAGAQGKFWDMHDMLYEHQEELAEVDLVQYALKIGLEVYQFEADLSAERFAKRVQEDFDSGVRSGVNGTPTFFINGFRYNGKPELAAMLEALEHGGVDSE
jgi:protein-disulfide isomerase